MEFFPRRIKIPGYSIVTLVLLEDGGLKEEKNKEDTWKADELEKSIKDALSDTSEKKRRHSKIKKSSKDTQRKADVNDEYLTRDKHLKENKPERLPDQNDRSTVNQDRAKSKIKDEPNQLQDLDKHERPRHKEKSRSRKDDSTKKVEKKRGKHQQEKDEDGRENSKRHEIQRESSQKDADKRNQKATKRTEKQKHMREEVYNNPDEERLPKGEVDVLKEKELTLDGNYDGDNYDDDFEDYEDDFEDVADNGDPDDVYGYNDSEGRKEVEFSEMAALRRAMEEENKVILRQSQEITSVSSKSSASSIPATTRSRQTFVNFTAAKQRQIKSKLSKKAVQRGLELMNLIELDVSSSSLFEMAPVKVYELYIKTYGRSNTKQAFVQCHEDVLDRDIQTETIETRDAWNQYPSQGTSIVSEYSEDSQAHYEDNALNKVNSFRLTQFLGNAGQVMNVLLEENVADTSKSDIRSNQRNILFSQGYTQLTSEFPFLKGRFVTHAQFHPVQTNLLLTVYSIPKEIDESGSHQGIVCVWNVNDSSQPYRILTCKSEVKSCCFSPIKSTFAFAGTIDGAILVWDLREPSSMHQIMHHGDIDWYLRVPTYSTNGVHKDETHHSAVITVQPITTTQDSLQASIHNAGPSKYSEDMHGLSFQLASLDEQGVIHFWVVIELDKTDSAGSATDLGLVPSGKVKLIRSSSITLENHSRNMSQAIQAKDMKFALNDPSHFYVATDSGILHGSRHGDRVSPKCYRRQIDVPVDVIQLDFSPFGLPYFLAASTDGCICLYSLALDSPLISWSSSTGDLPIISISWSRSRPSVFYVVDVTSKVYVWELLACQGGPVKTEQFSHGRLTVIGLSNDHLATGRGVQGSKPAMVITDDKGALDVHVLNQHFSVASKDELQQMVAFLNTFN